MNDFEDDYGSDATTMVEDVCVAFKNPVEDDDGTVLQFLIEFTRRHALLEIIVTEESYEGILCMR